MTGRAGEETLAEGISAGEVLAAMAGQEKCTKPFAANVERIVKFLSSQPAVNPFIAAHVLKKPAEPIQEGSKTEAQEGPILKEEPRPDRKTMNRLKPVTAN